MAQVGLRFLFLQVPTCQERPGCPHCAEAHEKLLMMEDKLMELQDSGRFRVRLDWIFYTKLLSLAGLPTLKLLFMFSHSDSMCNKMFFFGSWVVSSWIEFSSGSITPPWISRRDTGNTEKNKDRKGLLNVDLVLRILKKYCRCRYRSCFDGLLEASHDLLVLWC